ncbi:MAG: ribonuclease J [Lachnospiraceae bacterium]|nr:ribonuclease J [Lachnospiraceae bacterium]MBR3638566.1 ribonuclease J [Lachnospiraceae bacterium]
MKDDTKGVHPSIKIIPLGGLEHIGMNITVFEYEDEIIVVDCGLSFPTEDMLGIDLVIPDVTYLKENRNKIKGFFITHGHEDHIGALPYILKEVNVPVFATMLTMGLIERKLKEHKILDTVDRSIVDFGNVVKVGSISVEFIKTNHSIVDAAALAIYSPAGVIIHTGDFKVDYTPVFGDAIDLQRFAELGKKGVLALLCDSTNAERPGFTPSEKTLGRVFDNIFHEHENRRILVATFASNVDRVQQIINTAHSYGRKVAVEGRSMINIINTAMELGRLSMPENTLIDVDEILNYPNEKTVIITTGSQGESMAALSRMASGTHRKIKITPMDTVIFSSHPIPGNETAITKVINDLQLKGAEVVFHDTHVSGHACKEEIKLIYSLTQPKYAVPVHGEFKHLKAQEAIAKELGMASENIIILHSGQILSLSDEHAEIIGDAPAGEIYVDGLGVGDVGSSVMRERQILGADGIVVVTLVIDSYSGEYLAGPTITSRGFVYMKDAEDLLEEATALAYEKLEKLRGQGVSDWGRLKGALKDTLGDYFRKKTKREPMILSVFEEV